MLDADEAAAVAEQFGVARSQVRRDHLISHLLAATSQHLSGDLLFFGGTALSRTFAPHGRISEDIDLIAHSNRSRSAQALDNTLIRATRREYPSLHWQPRSRPSMTPHLAYSSRPTARTYASSYSAQLATHPGPPNSTQWCNATAPPHRPP